MGYNTDVTIKRPIKLINIRLLGEALAYISELLLGLITLTKEKPDLIYTRDFFSARTFILTTLFKCPWIIEVNGLLKEQLKVSSKKMSTYLKIMGYIRAQANENTYKYSQHLIAVTSGIKNALEIGYNIDPSNITVIKNGANIDLFKPMAATKAKEKLNRDKNINYVCFIGHLETWQGVEYLIKSAPAVLEECQDTRFLIVGDGMMNGKLIKLAEQLGILNEVIFTGFASYSSVPIYINASDVCVAPKIPLKSGYSPLKLYEIPGMWKASNSNKCRTLSRDN